MSTDTPTAEMARRESWPSDNRSRSFEAVIPPLRVDIGNPNAPSSDSRADVVLADLTSAPQLSSPLPPLVWRTVNERPGTCSCADMVYDVLGFHSSLLGEGLPAVRLPVW
jgi:hypothetical protein